MAKITSTRTFDVGRVIASLAAKGIGDLEDFLTYVQDFSIQMISALNKTLTVEQNLDSDNRVVSLISGVSQNIRIQDPKKVPVHVLVSKCIPFNNPIDTFNWQITQDGSLQVMATFIGAPTSAVQVSLIVLF